jgi:hypothetical protein
MPVKCHWQEEKILINKKKKVVFDQLKTILKERNESCYFLFIE